MSAPRSPYGDYVELRCRSAFSFLEAASNPEDLVEAAAELGHPALALADRGGLYGIPRFHQAARRAGIRRVLLPERNRRDAEEIQAASLEGIELAYVSTIDEVLDRALLPADG